VKKIPWNEREVNAGPTKSAPHHGQKSPAANDDQTVFKSAVAIVLKIKDNERHRLLGAEEKNGKDRNQLKALLAEPI